MPRTLFFTILYIALGASSPSWAAGFTLTDLRPGSGAIAFTEQRGPHAYTADGGLIFDVDWDAVGDRPVRLDLKMSWVTHVSPQNDGVLAGDRMGLGGYMYSGLGESGDDWAAVEPDYQDWSANAVAFGYASLTPEFDRYSIVWDMFGWADSVDWRLEYTLAPVPLPAAGLLLGAALGLAAPLSRRTARKA